MTSFFVKVIANGKSVNYEREPFQIGAFVAFRDAEFVVIEGDMGITIGCIGSFDLCAVQVSGFYHGKLLGVLGKYNNEPNDDLTLPNGQVIREFKRNSKICSNLLNLSLVGVYERRNFSEKLESEQAMLRKDNPKRRIHKDP